MRKFKNFGGTKALIHTGQLRNSITTKVNPSKMEAFVVILYQSKHKGSGKKAKSQSMVNIAKVHEYGTKPFLVKRTLKMQRFLAMVAKETGVIKRLIVFLKKIL